MTQQSANCLIITLTLNAPRCKTVTEPVKTDRRKPHFFREAPKVGPVSPGLNGGGGVGEKIELRLHNFPDRTDIRREFPRERNLPV